MQIIVETYNNGSPTPEFNNAGQIFNHDFYWESISPEKRETPHGKASFNASARVSSNSCQESCFNGAELYRHCCEGHHAAPCSV